jgi:hypothetical protein
MRTVLAQRSVDPTTCKSLLETVRPQASNLVFPSTCHTSSTHHVDKVKACPQRVVLTCEYVGGVRFHFFSSE